MGPFSDLATRNLLGEFQDRIVTVRVRVHVGSPKLVTTRQI